MGLDLIDFGLFTKCARPRVPSPRIQCKPPIELQRDQSSLTPLTLMIAGRVLIKTAGVRGGYALDDPLFAEWLRAGRQLEIDRRA